MTDLKSALWKYGAGWYFLAQNAYIWEFGSKFEKQKLEKNSRFTQFWNFGSIRVVSEFFKCCSDGFGSFRLVSGRFGSFRVLVSTLVCLLKRLMGELTFVRVLFSEVFYKQTVLKNFGNVLEKQVCWNLYLIKFIICFIFINAIRIM